jgi:poly-gamma-glutamate capsule biosynthesis protein CapA/YwtB (metallophosphatase superfamily)
MSVVTLALCGDVMLGRGIDQVLPHPGDPTLREDYALQAGAYVALAEQANGPIPAPVDFSWPWGQALSALDEAAPDARVVNLETSVTRSDEFAPGKAVHYRMSPDNLPCLSLARPDVCALANNHVLDFGRRGLEETLAVLGGAGLTVAGAGPDLEQARRPATVPLRHGGRALVFAFGMPSSGVPTSWAATPSRSGVDVVRETSAGEAAEVVERVRRHRRPDDLVVVSVHWGSNWGHQVPAAQTRFAHALVDGGVDLVHGHSSHHPRPIEVYRGRLVLYGCGDFINDYEGIAGHEGYRDDLRLLYLASFDTDTRALRALRMIPMQARRLRLEHASDVDAEWLRAVLDRTSRPLGSRVGRGPEGALTLDSA